MEVALLSRTFLMFAFFTFVLAGIHRFFDVLVGVTARGMLHGAEAMALLSIACGVVHVFEQMAKQKAPE